MTALVDQDAESDHADSLFDRYEVRRREDPSNLFGNATFGLNMSLPLNLVEGDLR